MLCYIKNEEKENIFLFLQNLGSALLEYMTLMWSKQCEGYIYIYIERERDFISDDFLFPDIIVTEVNHCNIVCAKSFSIN